jgi:dipeptidyl aminopeptidase/acylaminoacyl peptidase
MIDDRRAAGVLLALVAGAAWLPAAAAVTAADYARAESFLPARADALVLHTVESPTWFGKDTLWYRTDSSQGTEFLRVDPAHRTREPAFDQAAIARALAQAANRPVDPEHLPFDSLELPATQSALQFNAFAKRWSCSLPAGPCAVVAAPDGNAAASPDGSLAVFIRNNNLWRRDTTTGEERALTTDGTTNFGYATDNPGWEHTDHAIVHWSPDGSKVATYQQDQRGVGDMFLVSTQAGHPTLEAWKYAMSGDAVIATIERVIVDVNTGRVVRLQVPADAHRSSVCYDLQCGDNVFADTQWSADGTQLAFVSTSRDHKLARLRIADAATGAVRDVLEERSPTFYESDISSTSHGAINWRFLPRSNRIIWFSERSGRAHLYLYDLATGRLLHPLTQGDWDVVEILRVDESAQEVYFTAVGHERGRDPYYVHLYRVGFDGRDLRLLTPENANHDITMAPSGRYFLDRYSTPQTPPVAVIRDATGRVRMTLESADWAPLRATGWEPPQSIIVKARDGTTDLYGLMFKPTHLDPNARYPIIDWVYPGPQTGSVGSRSFAAARGDRQALAELGFIVVAIDGMGTPFRGKAFHDTYFGRMRDNTLPDQVAGIRALGAQYPFVDLERVGIYGHSGGGYAAAAAMFTYPDFFKVGIAESGNHDQRDYTDDWGDKFGAAGDSAQDNFSIAKNLKGHLLLSHGTMDDNVPPYLTLRLVDALIEANKDFDLVLLPNQHHPYMGQSGRYMTRRRWDYFVRYLLQAEPPHEYAFQSSAESAQDED